MPYRSYDDDPIQQKLKSFLTIGRVIYAVVVVLVGFVLTGILGCNTVAPNNGFEAVLVKKPLIFGHGGVDPTPVKTGRTFVAPTTDAIYVSMQPIQAELKADDLMTNDGVPLNFDAIIRLQVTDSVGLISKFGDRWYANNIEREFSNRIRQAVRKHGLNETAIQPVAISDIDNEVSVGMENYMKSIKIPVRLVAVTVGKAIPPDSIKNQRIETASQQQRILTEGQVKLAEDARKLAEESRAAADNAYRNEMGLNPDQFLQLSSINAWHDVCRNGAKCTFIQNASKSQPILDAK
jgi:regulator of protease activity HflC (stomatin/prohibitin superfamily)